MSWLVQSRGMVDHTITIALLIQLVLFVTWSMAYASVFLIITNSAPSKNVLGAINGLGQTSASAARAVGLASATSLFAFSKEHNVLNGNAVYVVFIVLTGVLSGAAHGWDRSCQMTYKIGTNEKVGTETDISDAQQVSVHCIGRN
ncbi:hypothetical protein M405DRAFT_937664 [Rhizopogon salebrosus TDB-379]|nr:hypothetical protein M405DRAFT_937664 [Rhizopogon salebrosus TDB-379]